MPTNPCAVVVWRHESCRRSMRPNRDAVIRLIGAVVCERHDEWIASKRRYPSLGVLAATRRLVETGRTGGRQRGG